MGVVYEAEQQHPKRTVALKVIRGGASVDESQVRLFQREAQTLASLKHRSIAAISKPGARRWVSTSLRWSLCAARHWIST